MLRLENSWSENCPERSEHARRDRCPVCTEGKTIPSCATGVEPAGDHQWWAVFFDNHIQAVHRELKEETGLSCTILAELTPLALEKDGIKTITRVFLGKASSTKVILSSEHTAFRWVLPKEVDHLENVIYKELLKKYLIEAEKIG